MTAYTARPFTTSFLQFGVHQVAHGFSIGDVLRFDGANYVLAQADSEINAEVVGMVSYIVDADNFILTQVGYVFGITTISMTPGTLYYLSPSVAGSLTATKPTSSNQVIVPLIISITSDSGFFTANVGDLIGSGDVFAWNTVSVDTDMAVNNGYFIDSGSGLIMTLPITANVGDIIRIATVSVNGVGIVQNDGQTINFVDADTTPGITGGLLLLETNTVLQGALEIVCTVQDTNFKVISGNGNWQVD